MAGSAYIERGSVTPTSEQVFSFSAWVKFSDVTSSTEQMIFNQTRDGVSTDSCNFYKKAGGTLTLYVVSGSSNLIDLNTDRKFVDCGAWYNLAFSINMADSTTGDRAQIFVNGVRETSFSTETYPGSTVNINCFDDNASNRTRIGGGAKESATVNMYLDGDLSHVHFVDGVAYAGSNWGSTDSTSGIWKIDPEPTVSSYGNRGFFLKMEDSSNLDLDSSPNATTMTTSGTVTATKDNPSNNFATMNPLDNFYCGATFSNGNTKVVTGSGVYAPVFGTLGVNASKWYWEVKLKAVGATYAGALIGVASSQTTAAAQELGHNANDYGFYGQDGKIRNNDAYATYGSAYAVSDIIGVALDVTNNKLYFSKNGVWENSGDPTSGATGTGAVSITIGTLDSWFPSASYWDSGTGTYEFNFGNGYFGTDAVASANADDAGIGAMEYDVPTGYYCLCTNNILTYG